MRAAWARIRLPLIFRRRLDWWQTKYYSFRYRRSNVPVLSRTSWQTLPSVGGVRSWSLLILRIALYPGADIRMKCVFAHSAKARPLVSSWSRCRRAASLLSSCFCFFESQMYFLLADIFFDTNLNSVVLEIRRHGRVKTMKFREGNLWISSVIIFNVFFKER